MAFPCHPGELIAEALADTSISEAAKAMGIARSTLSRVINGHATVTPDMAFRLSKYLGTSMELWLNLQTQYDVWEYEHHENPPQILQRQAVAIPA